MRFRDYKGGGCLVLAKGEKPPPILSEATAGAAERVEKAQTTLDNLKLTKFFKNFQPIINRELLRADAAFKT